MTPMTPEELYAHLARYRGGRLLWGLVHWFTSPGLLWFRVAGHGLVIKDTTRCPLAFSERVLGHGRQVGRWRVRYLARGGV